MRVTPIVVAAAAALLLVGCGADAEPAAHLPGAQSPGAQSADSSEAAQPSATAPLPTLDPIPGGLDRGALVSDVIIDGGDRVPAESGVVHRVQYRSRTGYVPGQPYDHGAPAGAEPGFGTVVSGIVAIPAGTAPDGGWPIVSLAHGTTGTMGNCGPSTAQNLGTSGSTIADLLGRGFAVAATDYQGLSPEAEAAGFRHAYVEPLTAGYDVIDAVRAARNVDPALSTRWAALGTSQGGQAVWQAGESAATYGDGLELLGVAAISPALDLTGVIGADGSISVEGQKLAVMPQLLYGLETVDPDVRDGDYLNGRLLEGGDSFRYCDEERSKYRLDILLHSSADSVRPSSEETKQRMVDWLDAMHLPVHPTAAPIFAQWGAEDVLINPEFTTHAINNACALGDTVQASIVPGKGHTDVDRTAALDWIAARFAGEPAQPGCAIS